MKRKKRKFPAERNFLVPMMRQNCKSAAHPDKKKEADRKACRIKLRPGWWWPPGPGPAKSRTTACFLPACTDPNSP